MSDPWKHFNKALRIFDLGFREADKGFAAAVDARSGLPPPPPGDYAFTARTWRERWAMAAKLRSMAWSILFTGRVGIRIKPRKGQ